MQNYTTERQIVTAAIIRHNDCILIAKRPPLDHLAGKWELPGGKLETGETPEQCLKREMFEEFHINVSVDSFFAESSYTYETGQIQLHAYFCTWLGGKITPSFHDEYKLICAQEVLDYDFAPADIPIVKALKDYLLTQPPETRSCCDNRNKF